MSGINKQTHERQQLKNVLKFKHCHLDDRKKSLIVSAERIKIHNTYRVAKKNLYWILCDDHHHLNR